MPSRIFFTSASVAAKMPWIFVVTSARFASSFVLVLPLSATSLASAAPLAPCMPATPAVVSAAASALPWSMTCCSCCAELRRVRCRRARPRPSCRPAPARTRGSFDSRQLRLVDLGLGHLLVGLVLAGREVDLLGRRRLRHRPGRGDRRRLAGLLRPHRRHRLGHRLGRVRRRLGRGLDVLGLALLALADQSLDLALDLTGLAGLLVVVGLLQRLRRLGLDRGLHRGDERLLVERPRLLGVHRVGLGGLGLPGQVVRRGQRGVLGLLGLRRCRAGAPACALANPLTFAGHRGEGRVLLRAVRRSAATGGCSSWSADSERRGGRGRSGRPRPAGRLRRRRRLGRRGRPAASPAGSSPPALPSGLTAGTAFGGGTGFFAGTDPGPEAGRGHRERRRRAASCPPDRPGRRRPSPPSDPSRRCRSPARPGGSPAAPRRCR